MLPTTHSRPSVLGESTRHFPVGRVASFDVQAQGYSKDEVDVSVVGPSKRALSYSVVDDEMGMYRVEFVPQEVGSHVVEVLVGGTKIHGSPFVAKAYDSSLIRVSDVPSGVVGQPCQFRVDASQAGEGQLEISINDGEVPNHVQVLGGGRCLVSFAPEVAKTHTIDIKFNGETVPGCPFICNVADTSRVTVNVRHLELIPINKAAKFQYTMDGGGSPEPTIYVRSPSTTLPVKITGNPKSGYTAEFTPAEVGHHTIVLEYNNLPVSGTPFTCKVYDSSKVYVSSVPRGSIGKSLQFTVDASQAGEGNLEITISARGRNIPTQVHPQGSARFAVSFVPLEAVDHVITITFNKEPVPGSPYTASVHADPNRIVASGQSLAMAPVGKMAEFTLSNIPGSVEDIEVNIEGPTGLPVPAQVRDNGDSTFLVEFSPRHAGEHRINVQYAHEQVPGSPFNCKVYDVDAIRVTPAKKGILMRPVTFLVETSQAGPGNLEVTVNQGQVPTSAQAQGHHTYAISFTPREAKTHHVELKFNGVNVPGSPFQLPVADVSRISLSGDGLSKWDKVSVGQKAKWTLETATEELENIRVQVLSPSRRPVPVDLEPDGEGKMMMEYTPTVVGDHVIEIKYLDQHIHGSPFTVKVYDATKVYVTDISNGVVDKPVYFSIDASQAGAGNLEIIVSVNGKNVPNYVQAEGNAKFRVQFRPQEAAVHTLSVKFNSESVPGSPFTCKVKDSSQIIVSGSGLKMSSLSKPAIFTIDPCGVDIGNCEVAVVSPIGNDLPVSLTGTAKTKYNAEFLPEEVGPHTVNVKIDSEPVRGSPFTCNIYDVSRVQVTGLTPSKVGKPVTFTVDASQAGEGTLELVVRNAKSSVRAEVTARSRGLYDVTFVPQEPISHEVYITFNDEEVVGSPFKCDIRDLDPKEIRHIRRTESKMVTAKGEGLSQVTVDALASFDIDVKGKEGDVDIVITAPDGIPLQCNIQKGTNGIYRAEYRPRKVGVYTIQVYHQGRPISKDPYLVYVSDPRLVQVVLVEEAFIGKECTCRVDTSKAGQVNFSVNVRAVGQEVKHSIHDRGDGQFDIRFRPRVAIPHKVDIKCNGVRIPDCPLKVVVSNPSAGKVITASGIGLHHSRANKTTSFVIETLGNEARDFDVLISGPEYEAVPMKCYQQRDGNLLAEFTPTKAGPYEIEIQHNSRNIQGSPYRCEVYDTSKVMLEDIKSTKVSVNEKIVFRLNREEAGLAELDVTAVSPMGKKLSLDVKGLPSREGDLIEFHPVEPGKYKFIILYGGEEVPGSPVIFMVEEERQIQVYGDGLTRGHYGHPVTFTVDSQGVSGLPQAQVDGPDSVAKCTIDRNSSDGTYTVTYVPQEVGIFDVRVLWNGREIQGSPFHPHVVSPEKVRVIGGWEHLLDDQGRLDLAVGQEKRISFDVGDAGPGKLVSEIQGPTGPINSGIEQTSPTRHRLTFIPMERGEHRIYLTYGGFSLPNSPLIGLAGGETLVDQSRVTLRGSGLTEAVCGREAEFIIDGSEAGMGSPEVTMSGNEEIKVQLQPLGNNIWKASYTPTVPESYVLNVTWAGRLVRGCPLKVTASSQCDSGKVLCTGDGLKFGTLGKEIKSTIDTRRAGPGELTTQCTGPHKTAYCELYDHQDGRFTLNLKPQEPGRHLLTIKYGGEHVPGSPYTVRVMGPPDPSKVRVYGPGVEHGVLASFQSRFLCETRGAGAGQLTVRIRGPKGAFRVEMQRESQKDRTILCKYDPTEPGDYRIEVRWSGEHVPGSPFTVMIFDTQEELARFLQVGYTPNSASPPSEFYGSLGYSTAYGQVSLSQMSWRGSQAQL